MNRIRNWLMVTLVLLLSVSLWGNKKAEAFYKNKQYPEAIKVYNKDMLKGASAALYYNLGNCYYRTGEWGMSVLYYEKARVLQPVDADINHNLKMAYSRCSDKQVMVSPGLGSWLLSVINVMKPDTYTFMGITGFMTALILYILYKRTGRKVFWRFSVPVLLISGVLYITGFFIALKINDHSTGIVVTPSVEARNEPSDESTASFVLHEGTRVEIETYRGEWVEISYDAQRNGWVRQEAVQAI